MNEKPPTEPVEEKVDGDQQKESQPADPQFRDARRRLRELLAIPERERSDELWDEIVKLEIQLAPGNCAPSVQADTGRRRDPGRRQEPGRRPEQGRRQEATSGPKPGKRFFKRPKRGTGTPTKS